MYNKTIQTVYQTHLSVDILALKINVLILKIREKVDIYQIKY